MSQPKIFDSSTTQKYVQWFLQQASDHAEGPLPYLGYASDVLVPLLGWPRGQVRERLSKALFIPANAEVLATQIAQQERGIFEPYSLSLPHRDGVSVSVLACPRPVVLPDGGETVTVSLVPAPLGGGEQRTVKAEQVRLRSLLDRLPAFIALLDAEHSLHYANKVYYELFGSGDRGKSQEALPVAPEDVFETGSLAIREWTDPQTDNVYRLYAYPFDEMDGRRLALVMGTDITQGKRAQDALALSEERYRSITDNLAVGIAIVHADMRVTAANPLFTHWFLHNEGGEAIFTTLLAEYFLDDAQFSQEHLLTFVDGKVHDYELVSPLGGEAGEGRIYRLTSCPISSLDGGVDDIIVLLEDVTERRRVADRLHRVRKLEAMGTLAAGIAHEINQPLSALQLYASGLEMMLERDRAIPPDTLLTRLGFILREADKIREIIAHMRTLVMQEDAPPVRDVCVNEVVETALKLVGAQLFSHGIALELALGKALPRVRANSVQLEQVVINLVVNAMHALDTQQRIAKRVCIRTRLHDESNVTLDVMDNGPGIQGLESRIFDPFFTTKEAGAGMGLGLAIVHSFVESWGGEIATSPGLEDTDGQNIGTTFSVVLPAVVEDENAHFDC